MGQNRRTGYRAAHKGRAAMLDSAQETAANETLQARARARTLRDRLYALICDASENGRAMPGNAELGRAFGVSNSAVKDALAALSRSEISIVALIYASGRGQRGHKVRIIEVTATGRRTSSDLSRLAIPELPPEQSDAKEAGAAQLPPAPCQTEPAADEAGQPNRRPASLASTYTDWHIKRANGDLTPRAINTALTAKDRCQWILNDGWPYRFCGARRDHPDGAYCPTHARRAYRKAITVLTDDELTPEELHARREKGRRIRAGLTLAQTERQLEGASFYGETR